MPPESNVPIPTWVVLYNNMGPPKLVIYTTYWSGNTSGLQPVGSENPLLWWFRLKIQPLASTSALMTTGEDYLISYWITFFDGLVCLILWWSWWGLRLWPPSWWGSRLQGLPGTCRSPSPQCGGNCLPSGPSWRVFLMMLTGDYSRCGHFQVL